MKKYFKLISYFIILIFLINILTTVKINAKVLSNLDNKQKVDIIKDTKKGNLEKLELEKENLGYKSPKLNLVPSNEKIDRNSLPRRYDLRNFNEVNSVNHQGELSTCWAFTTYGSLESTILREKGKSYDFSEINMATNNPYTKPDEGGNYFMASEYFMKMKGAVREIEDPYPYPSNVKNIRYNNNIKPFMCVFNSLFIPDRRDSLDNSIIKSMLMKHGAVATSILYKLDSYYNQTTSSLYCPRKTFIEPNHGILIVGWDDDYSKYNFLEIPKGDGAFICKNSYGKEFGEDGYFYVSYYDAWIGTDNAVFYGVEDINNYRTIYKDGNEVQEKEGKDLSYIYTYKCEKDNEALSSISFLTKNNDFNYEVYVEKDKNLNGDINKNKILSGKIEYAGYHTVKFPKLIDIQKDKNFKIKLKVSKSIDKSGAILSKLKSKVSVKNLEFNSENLNLNYNEKFKLIPNIELEKYKHILKWSTTDKDVAVVDDDGVVTARKSGQAIVSLSTLDDTLKVQCKVNVSGNIKLINYYPKNEEIIDCNTKNILMIFNDNIYKGREFTNIKILDENNRMLRITKKIDNNNLNINISAEERYKGNVRLIIPSNAIINNIGIGLKYDFNKKFYYDYIDKDEKFEIKDKNLEKSIKESLEIDVNSDYKLSVRDMLRLKSLYLYGIDGDIKDFSSLKYAKNLSILSITDINIVNLESLSELYKLNEIKLNNCNIKDISFITKLKNLYKLDLAYNYITNLEPIRNLTRLNSIILMNNCIENVEPLLSLKNIESIDLENNQIKDVSVLRDFKKLEALYLSKNNISNVSFLKDLLNNVIYKEKLGVDLQYNNINKNEELDNINFKYNSNDALLKIDKQNGLYVKKLFNKNKKEYNDINPNENIEIVFNKDIKLKQIDKAISIKSYGDNRALRFKVINVGNKLIIKPLQSLKCNTRYYITINNDFIDEKNNFINNRRDKLFFNTALEVVEDINKDGKVDIKDIAILAEIYNINKNHKDWKEDYDLNKDGIINIFDLVRVSSMIK